MIADEDEDADLLVGRVHIACKHLMESVRTKQNLEAAIALLAALMPELRSDRWGERDRATARGSALVALRVIVEKTRPNAQLSTRFADVVVAALQVVPIPWEHLQPLLTWFFFKCSTIPNVPCLDSVTLRSLLDKAVFILNFVLQRDSLRREFLEFPIEKCIGGVISALLDVFEDNSRDHDIRRKAGEGLSRIVDAARVMGTEKPVVNVVFALPGLIGRLAKAAIAPNAHKNIVVTVLQVFDALVCSCFSDRFELVEPGPSEQFGVNRDIEWYEAMTTQCHERLKILTARFSRHSEPLVRLRLIALLKSVTMECEKRPWAEATSLDALLLLRTDSDLKVASEAKKLLDWFKGKRKTFLSKRLDELLREAAQKLPVALRKGDDAEALFDQLEGVLVTLRETGGLRVLLTASGTQMESLLSSFAASIRVDLKRMMISKNEGGSSIQDFITSLPLLFGVKWTRVFSICAAFVESDEDAQDILECLASALNDASSQDRTAYVILAMKVIEHWSPSDPLVADHVLRLLVETQLELITKINIEPEVKDEIVEDTSRAHSQASVEAAVLHCGLAIALKPVSDQQAKKLLLMETLYALLKWSTVTNFGVVEATNRALAHLADSNDVSSLLSAHTTYLVHRAGVFTRRAWTSTSTEEGGGGAMVLAALLERVDHPKLFEQARNITTELVDALDHHNLEWSLLALRVLRSWVRAITRWFPDLKPLPLPDVEDEELEEGLKELPKAPAPAPIASVVSILHRTKHLASSPHFPVRIVALDILEVGLMAIREFDDELLPLIHQNWPAILARSSDDEFTTRRAALKVVLAMVRTSRTFVYRRVRDEFWPRVMKGRTKKKLSLSPLSAEFKFLVELLQATPELWKGIDLTKEDRQLVIPFLEQFTEDGQLAKFAKKAILEIDDFLMKEEKTASRSLC